MNEAIRLKLRIVVIVFFSSMGGMLYGYDIGIINSAFLFINKDIPMTVFETSILGGSVLFGGAFAILLAGIIADVIGRKNTLKLSGLIFIISVLMIYESHSYELLLASRLIQGISVGFITVTVPLYLTETVPSKVRGVSVTCFQLFLTAGILISNYVGLLFESSQDWRAMFLTSLVPALIFFIGCFFILKSPRWLVLKNKPSEALKVLQKFFNRDEAQEQIQKVEETLSDNDHTFLGIVSNRHYLIPSLLVIAIAILNQLTGINSILQFSATLLKDAGLGGDYISIVGGVTITAINFLTTLIAVFIAEKLERKFIITFGTISVAITLLLIGIAMAVLPTSELQGWVLLCGLVCFIFFFAIGPGAYIWIILSELLPNSIRSKVLGIALFLNSIASAILASVFLPILNTFGDPSVFFICGIFTLIYCLIVYKFVPKTTGRSLEEIEQEFM